MSGATGSLLRGEKQGVVGAPLNRVDGRLKVMGEATFTAEFPLEHLAYGALVQSTVARGTITAMDTDAAAHAPGVIAVLTPWNAERLPESGRGAWNPPARALTLLQDRDVHYNGQPIGIVVAESFEEASYGASLVRATYADQPPDVELAPALASAYPYATKIFGREPCDSRRGDLAAGLAEADARIDTVYTTPLENHNPMELHATIASWSEEGTGTKLTLHDSTQNVVGVRNTAARIFGLAAEEVRVVSLFCGGGFGGKGTAWSHVMLTAMAARATRRSVKTVLTRRQMFGPVGGRPHTVQHVTLGAKRDGTLTAIRHASTSSTSTLEDWLEPAALVTRHLHECPNVETTHRLVRLDVGSPTFMRAPGEATGTFALECALDELAVELRMDPIALRLKNYAEQDPESGKPWSSKSLRECYVAGARRFGWERRTPAPRSMRDGQLLIGYGMATATYPARRMPASASVRITADGHAVVRSATHELGTGTYTVMTQIAADALGIAPSRVRFELGDTDFPPSGISAGSMTAASTGSAVHLACRDARARLIALATADAASPVFRLADDDVLVDNGRLTRRDDPSVGETVEDLLRRQGAVVETRADTKPGDEVHRYSMHSFGATFAEVRVDPDLGEIRLARFLGAYGAGRILNAKTARSQIIGGVVFGLGMALLEHTAVDERTGRYVNADIAEYHIPVHADVPPVDVLLVDEHDPHVNPIGVKGIGEIGMTGVAAAIVNAVYHATGVRVRELPVTLDKLLVASG